MDYAKIYEAFISDRQAKQPERPAYFEKHHILPRSLAGSDEAANLIRLTPEDHFFAHLLLAHMHGGKLWAPIAFMVGGSRKDYKPTASRKGYGWAARAMAKAMAGSGAHQFDHRIHHLTNLDGRSWSGLQSEIVELGLSKSLGNMVLKGKIKAAKGWYPSFQSVPSRSGISHHMYRHEVHTFCHVDGRVYVGTQHGLHLEHGLPKPAASMLANGKAIVRSGWYLQGADLPRIGRAAKLRAA